MSITLTCSHAAVGLEWLTIMANTAGHRDLRSFIMIPIRERNLVGDENAHTDSEPSKVLVGRVTQKVP